MRFDRLLIDGRNLMFRSVWAHQALSHEGRLTGGIYGFVSTLLSLYKRYGNPTIEVCWEGTRNYRYSIYPAYKGNRSKKPKKPNDFDTVGAVTVQQPVVQKLLRLAAVTQWYTKDGECDDVLYTRAKQLTEEEGLSVGIVTQDKDLYQAVALPGVSLIRSVGNAWEVYGRKEVEDELGVPPELVAELKAIGGDTGDNIPGVRGIGPKIASKLLLAHKSLGKLLAEAGVKAAWKGTEAQRVKVVGAADEVNTYFKLTKINPVDIFAFESESVACLPELTDLLHSYGIVGFNADLETICDFGGTSAWHS